MPSVQKGGTEISGELGGGGGGCTHTSAARCVVLDEPDAARLLLTLQPLPPTGDAVEGKLRSSWKRGRGPFSKTHHSSTACSAAPTTRGCRAFRSFPNFIYRVDAKGKTGSRCCLSDDGRQKQSNWMNQSVNHWAETCPVSGWGSPGWPC